MENLESVSDPPDAFPAVARRRRSSRIAKKRKASKESHKTWQPPCSMEDVIGAGKPVNEMEKRQQKFKNINTGEVFKKECADEMQKALLPLKSSKRERRKNSPPQPETPVLQPRKGRGKAAERLQVQAVEQAKKLVETQDLGLSNDWGPEDVALAPSYDAVFYPTNVVDAESLQWCDGRHIHKTPDYELLEALLGASLEKNTESNMDPSKMFNRSSGSGDGKSSSMLHNLRKANRKRGNMNKGIYVSKRYKKQRVVEMKPKSIVGDPTTLNYLDSAVLEHLTEELRKSMDESTGDASLLLKILKDSQFDAERAVEHGLDILLVELSQKKSEPSLAKPAGDVLYCIRKVL